MAVESASSVRAGDRIRIDDGGTEVECEVEGTANAPGMTVIGVMLADEYRQFEMLPDDSVMVTFYSEGYADE